MAIDLFESVNTRTDTPQETLFDDINLDNTASTINRGALTNRALVLALARMRDDEDPEISLESGVQQARDLLENMEEQNVRNEIAISRTVGRMTALSNLKNDIGPLITPEQSQNIDRAYNEVSQWDITNRAQIAAEEAAVDKIEEMAARDPVQAKLLLDNLEHGDANQTKRDFQVRMLKLQQLAEIYEQERGEEGWGSFLVNFALGLIPTNYNFSRTGIVEGDNSATDFLTPGSALSKQGQNLFNMPMDEFLEYVKEGGELDTAIRANADDFLFGKYDPTAATDIINQLTVQTESDRFWANTWGAVEIASLIPVTKVARATETLATSGARREAVNAVRETAEAIINEGPQAAAKKYGITEKEVIDGQSISAINPDVSNPNRVPLGLDVAARDEAARKALADLPGIVQADRGLSVEELKAAYDEAVKQVEAQAGRPIKDVSEVKTEVLADGTNIKYVEVTFGKVDGGGFASTRTARNASRSWGLPGSQIVEEIVTRVELKGGVPKTHTLKVYHGTDGDFADLRASQGGKLGPGAYFTPDPDTAADYTTISGLGKKYYTPASQSGGPNIRPFFVNPDKLFGYNQIEGWSLDDMRAAFKELGLEDEEFIRDAESMLTSRKERARDQLLASGYDVTDDMLVKYDKLDSQTFIKHLQRVFDKVDTENGWSIGAGLAFKLDQLGYDGLAGNMWGDIEISLFNPKNAVSQFNPMQEIKDISGQYFVKTRVNIPESGFYTDPLHGGSQSWWAKMIGTAPRVSDKMLHGRAVSAGSTINRMNRIIENTVLKPFRTLPPQSKEIVRQIAAAGTNAQRWWSDEEFNIMATRAYGRPATEQELAAYRALQTANDMDWVLRNDLMYKELTLNGFQNVKLNTKWGGEPIEAVAEVRFDFQKPSGRVYDMTNDVHYHSGNTLSDARFEQLKNEGFALVRTKGTVKMPDGVEINQILIKKQDADFQELRRTQLPYAEGGHRLYEADYRYFVKQASFGKQPDTGEDFMRNPNTFVAARNIAEANRWAETMNRALRMVNEEDGVTAIRLDEEVFMGNRAFPSGEEFLRRLETGQIDRKHQFEALYDRELPSAYRDASPNALSFMDVDDLGANDYLRTTGRLYYGGKGEALKDTTGELAMTVDPFDAIATSLRNITRQSGLANYKFEAFDRFMKTYGEEYLEPGKWKTPVDIFNNAPIKRGTPQKIEDQINAQRAATRTVLGFETPLERAYQDRARQAAEWVLGAGDNKARQMAHDAVWWWKSSNPLSKLRGLAFDAKLGMFNIGQLFVQTSTIASAIALNPKYGLKGAMGILPMHGYLLSRGSEAVLDTLAKRGLSKSMGFASEAEFKNYARMAYNSGFMDMNGSHVMVGEYGPAAAFGSFGEKLHRGREAARVFFYTAETYNRLVAFRIAYGEVQDMGIKITDNQFIPKVMALADDYSFNMTHEASSWWQKGVLSIPTQFWAYNLRMMDAMFGSRFTTAQKLRLMGMQVVLAGSAGIPLVEALSAYMKNEQGTAPEIDSLLGTLDRGLVDRWWYELTGADVRVGEKLGTGGWVTDLVKDVFGYSEYGEKPFDEMLGGASWSITKDSFNVLYQTMKYVSAERGTGPLARDSLLKMAMEVSTLGNAVKANMVANYGMYRSKSGTILASDLPSEDALFVALGFRPEEASNLGHMMNYLENRKESIDEAAKVIRNWRQEAFTNPDKYKENMEKVNAFMALQRPEDRTEILRQTNRITDESLYQRIAQKYNEQTLKERAFNGELD